MPNAASVSDTGDTALATKKHLKISCEVTELTSELLVILRQFLQLGWLGRIDLQFRSELIQRIPLNPNSLISVTDGCNSPNNRESWKGDSTKAELNR